MGLNNLIASERWFCLVKSVERIEALFFFKRFAARIDPICRITTFIKIIGS